MKRLLVVPILLLAACGGGGNSAPKSLHDAVAATMGSSVHEDVTAVTPTASGTSTSKATGTYAFSSHSGSFTVDTGALVGKVDAVLNGDTLYVKVPAALATVLPAGKRWVSADLNKPPTIPGTGNLTTLAGGTDPQRAFYGLLHATSVTKAGNHYTAHVDLSKDTSPLATSERTLVAGSVFTVDATVGTDGRLSQMVMHVPLTGGGTSTITVNYSGFGAAVGVTVPPAGQVIDAGSALQP